MDPAPDAGRTVTLREALESGGRPLGWLMGTAGILMSATDFLARRPDPTEAEVRHIDRERQRLTLRHGELQGLNMPPMTMVFRVRNPALLNGLQVGTRVRIQVVSEGGSMVVTDLQVLP